MLQGLGFDAEKARNAAARAVEWWGARQAGSRETAGERGRCTASRRANQSPRPGDNALARGVSPKYRKTVLFISHDRAFLANVVDHVLHLEGGSAVAYTGGYESFVAQREERRLSQQRAFDKQRKVIAEEEDYIRRNIAGQNIKAGEGQAQASRAATHD